MKSKGKKLKIMMGILVIFLLSQFVVAQAAGEYFADGGAEEDGIAWLMWNSANSIDQFKIAEDISHSGSKSLWIDNGESKDYSTYYQWLAGMEQGKEYVLSGWIKTKDVAGDEDQPKVFLTVLFRDENSAVLGDIKTESLDGTNDWTYVQEKFTLHEKCVNLSVQAVVNYASGSAWFDDITIAEAGSNAGTTSSNPKTADAGVLSYVLLTALSGAAVSGGIMMASRMKKRSK